MAHDEKPNGWYRNIPKTNQGAFKRNGVPFGFFMHVGFACIFVGGWFGQYLTAFGLWLGAMYVARQLTTHDDRWWDILSAKFAVWARRYVKNRFRSFRPFLDT